MQPTPDHTEAYADAVRALTMATLLVPRFTDINGRSALRVDIGPDRYLTAIRTNEPGDPPDADAVESWRVQVFEHTPGGAAPRLLAARTASWLIDAYDAAMADLP
ncbi:hypothetical protein P0W64_13570 [Tsukamurella sp. 8F]|uniref:hypothetical protein n=1 Tax=unclassified Tsukamurella TaxID=2633480 RepID=UPI0023BA0606|nr:MULTISPECIES: hypothetical protein [unclassified Tsukamurella]MDF0530601.1 hypothetical protein [Tsukamurella sp. 8J]MDF0587802.1 hypothetical protein [Tsukamurella sp. 8F]